MANTKFNGATKTVTGIEVKDVRFNAIPGKYIGLVYDKDFQGGKFRTASWHKTGKHISPNHQHWNLVEPKKEG